MTVDDCHPLSNEALHYVQPVPIIHNANNTMF